MGQLLHIHPLTLEDILQQDPREKLELFSKLGYYFISFRTIESQATRDKIRRETGLVDTPNRSTLDEGSIGEANVYLTIFKDGICCVCLLFPLKRPRLIIRFVVPFHRHIRYVQHSCILVDLNSMSIRTYQSCTKQTDSSRTTCEPEQIIR